MKLTPEQKDEANYEIWIMNDGPEKHTKKHQELARQYLDELVNMDGWKVLSTEMVRDYDTSKMEAVIRRGDVLKLIHWNSFNKGFMEKGPSGGWFIFERGAN